MLESAGKGVRLMHAGTLLGDIVDWLLNPSEESEARERMDIISAYREVGSYRGAAAMCATTPKTVRRVIERHESGGVGAERKPRERNYEPVADLVAKKVTATQGRISAKRLLPEMRAAGYEGSARNFRRLVAEAKAEWRRAHHRGRRPSVSSRASIWSSTGIAALADHSPLDARWVRDHGPALAPSPQPTPTAPISPAPSGS